MYTSADFSPPKGEENLLTTELQSVERYMQIISDFQGNYLPPKILINHKVSSQTVEWMKFSTPDDMNKNYISFSNGKQLIIAALEIPESSDSPPVCSNDMLKIEKRITSDANILKARSEPRSPWIIATQSTLKDILIFNCEEHSSESDSIAVPLIRVQGHESGGAALSWNSLVEGTLLSGSMDKKIIMWNFNPQINLRKVAEFSDHDGCVTGVEWMPFDYHSFGSVDDNKYLMLWDVRLGSTPVHHFVAHTDAVTSLNFNPLVNHLLATASMDNTAAIWDLRQLKEKYLKIHEVVSHTEGNTGIKWSPNSKSVFAVIGDNGQTNIFNLYKSTMQSYSHAENSLQRDSMFIRKGGHGRLNDISWHPNKPMLLASVAVNNFSAWQIPSVVWENIETGINSEPVAVQFQKSFSWNAREPFEL